jgi:hypothetical protein
MIWLSTENSNIESTFLTCAFHEIQVLPSRRPHGEWMSSSRKWYEIRDYGASFGCFHHWIVHVPRSLNLLLKLARTNVPKMMYVETQMQPTHQNTKYST